MSLVGAGVQRSLFNLRGPGSFDRTVVRRFGFPRRVPAGGGVRPLAPRSSFPGLAKWNEVAEGKGVALVGVPGEEDTFLPIHECECDHAVVRCIQKVIGPSGGREPNVEDGH